MTKIRRNSLNCFFEIWCSQVNGTLRRMHSRTYSQCGCIKRHRNRSHRLRPKGQRSRSPWYTMLSTKSNTTDIWTAARFGNLVGIIARAIDCASTNGHILKTHQAKRSKVKVKRLTHRCRSVCGVRIHSSRTA